MKVERIGNDNVVIPENKIERHIIKTLAVYMKPEAMGYWDVISSPDDPLDAEDRAGKMLVKIERADGKRSIGWFSIAKDDGGYFKVIERT